MITISLLGVGFSCRGGWWFEMVVVVVLIYVVSSFGLFSNVQWAGRWQWRVLTSIAGSGEESCGGSGGSVGRSWRWWLFLVWLVGKEEGRIYGFDWEDGEMSGRWGVLVFFPNFIWFFINMKLTFYQIWSFFCQLTVDHQFGPLTAYFWKIKDVHLYKLKVRVKYAKI